MMDKLDALRQTEAKHQAALRKTQQALHKAQQARKQEESRRHQQRWMLLGQTLEELMQLPPLAHLTPELVLDIWEAVGRFFCTEATADLEQALLKIRAQIVPEKG